VLEASRTVLLLTVACRFSSTDVTADSCCSQSGGGPVDDRRRELSRAENENVGARSAGAHVGGTCTARKEIWRALLRRGGRARVRTRHCVPFPVRTTSFTWPLARCLVCPCISATWARTAAAFSWRPSHRRSSGGSSAGFALAVYCPCC
jgi:hypothetical protein